MRIISLLDSGSRRNPQNGRFDLNSSQTFFDVNGASALYRLCSIAGSAFRGRYFLVRLDDPSRFREKPGETYAAGHCSQKLGEVKDAIGEWHDWEELIAIATDLLDHGPGSDLLHRLKTISSTKYEHALSLTNELRKTYLPSRLNRSST